MPYIIAIDKRERDIIKIMESLPEFKDHSGNQIEWRAEHLTTGDFIIFKENKAIMIIERKTWIDFGASIRDNRKKNIDKLIKFRATTGAKIAYLVEGVAFPSSGSKFARIPYVNIRAHLDHLVFRDDVIEIHTASLVATAERLFQLVRNISSITNRDVGEFIGAAETTSAVIDDLSAAKINHKKSNAEVVMKLWTSLPGITTNSYKLFSEIHISEILLGTITPQRISELKYSNGRKFGNRKAARLLKLSNIDHIRLLSAVPGISKKTAEIILHSHPLKTLISNWVELKIGISNLCRGKTLVGHKVTNTIESLLIKK